MDRERLELETRFAETSRAIGRLTERQRAVLDCVCAGQPTKAIAMQLKVSKRLIELERSKLLRAFNATGTAEIAVRIGEHRAMKYVRRDSASTASIHSSASMSVCTPQTLDEAVC